MMGGLDTPTSGNVIVRDKELSKMNDEQLTIFRRRNIGFIFQNYNLVPILNEKLDGKPIEMCIRDRDVYGSYAMTADNYHEERLTVVVNKLYVADQKVCACLLYTSRCV